MVEKDQKYRLRPDTYLYVTTTQPSVAAVTSNILRNLDKTSLGAVYLDMKLPFPRINPFTNDLPRFI